AGALLGAMGARVTKLEDLDRLDMYRRRGPYIEGLEGIEGSAYFAYMNHSKGSELVSTDDPEQLEAAIHDADVVIENLGPRRARRVGVDAAALSARRPGTLSVSSSGFGHTGPWSAYRVYAYNVHTCCGLAYLTRTETGVPPQVDIAWADLISGYALATVIAAWAVGTGARQGAAVDFSMVELAVSRFNEFLAAGSDVDHCSPVAPEGVYRTAVEGRWLAVSVATDEQWLAFRRALGDPVVLRGSDYATVPSRVAHRGDLDRLLDEHLSSWKPEEAEQVLQEAGVAAAAVATAEQLVRDPHLAAREFFRPVEHPLWGRRRLIGLPWRLAGEAPFDLGPPPRLGESGPRSRV
ncbi:MAG TPA: CoA transferase, partial [Acidimicrobiales bacterium]|nr:CoA transferase [Acidimicrobiales bacterium]